MAELRAPSLQHLVRNWRDDPVRIRNLLIGLIRRSPSFSYSPLNQIARDLLLYKVPLEQVEEGIRLKERRPFVRNNFLEIIPLIDAAFSAIRPDYVLDVAPQYYSIGRNLMVPFQPPLLYSVGGKQVLPWFVFWRTNPLSFAQTGLFVTMVKELMRGSPDLDRAEFQIIDLSVPPGADGRVLRVVDEKELPVVTIPERDRMLEVYVTGYELAQQDLARAPVIGKGHKQNEIASGQIEMILGKKD